MAPEHLNIFRIGESRPSLPTVLCSRPTPTPMCACMPARTRPVSFSTAVQPSPAGRNAGEVEVTEFPPLSCHLLATCGWLLEAAWAGKGSTRGSGLLLLAQEQSQQLQSCREVMPGAACVFLQVEADSGRVGWQPQPQRARREKSTGAAAWTPAPPCQALGACHQLGARPPLYPELPGSTGGAFPREHCGLGLGSPGLKPLCPGVVDLLRRVQKAPGRNQLELEPGTQPPAPQALSRPGGVASRFSLAAAPAWARRCFGHLP